MGGTGLWPRVWGPLHQKEITITYNEGKVTPLGGGGAVEEMTGLERYLLSDSERQREGDLRDGAEVPSLRVAEKVAGGSICSTLKGEGWRSDLQEEEQELSYELLSLRAPPDTQMVTGDVKRRTEYATGSSGLRISIWP